MLCEFDQIRLPKKIARGVLAGILIYGALVISFYWDAAHEEIVAIRFALVMILLLLSYFIFQFITGSSMTVWIASFEYDDNEWNIGFRWCVFIVSSITLVFFPCIAAYWVS